MYSRETTVSGRFLQLGLRSLTRLFVWQVTSNMNSASMTLIEASASSGNSFCVDNCSGGIATFLAMFCLGDSKSRMHHCAREDLHGHGIGIRSVKLLEFEDDLQIEKKTFDPPAHRIKRDDVLGSQTLRVQDVRERLVGLALYLQPYEPELDCVVAGSGLHQQVLDERPVHSDSTQLAYLLERECFVPPEQSDTRWFAEQPKELDRAVQTISQYQGPRPKALCRHHGTLVLRRCRIDVEPQLRSDSAEDVVDRQQATRQDRGFLRPKYLQPMGDFVQARAVEDHHIGEPLLEMGDLPAILLWSLALHLPDEACVERHEKSAGESFALLKESLRARSHFRQKASRISSSRAFENLAERRRWLED